MSNNHIKRFKSSPNPEIRYLWQDSSQNTNVKYDQYINTKQVLKAIQKQYQGRLEYELTSNGFIISSSITFASPKGTGFGPLFNKICQRTFSISP